MYEGEQTMRADSAGPAASQEHGALTASGNARVRVAGADEIHDGYDGTENASRSAKPLSYQNIASRPPWNTDHIPARAHSPPNARNH